MTLESEYFRTLAKGFGPRDREYFTTIKIGDLLDLIEMAQRAGRLETARPCRTCQKELEGDQRHYGICWTCYRIEEELRKRVEEGNIP